MGRNIVRKCKGLPLAIVVVAGHIRKSSRTHECWENVANNLKSILNSEENEQFFNILSFSYNHLPVHLKPCFVYMGSVPLVRSLRWKAVEQSFDLRLCRVLNYEIGRHIQEDDLQFFNLRYLRNAVSGSLYLPSSISLFWNLQTLIVEGDGSTFLAPNEIWKMIQLRHFEVLQGGFRFPDPLPSDVVMRNLQTLSGVHNFRFTEEVCKRVPNIKELKLRYDRDIWSECDEIRSYCCPHNLGCLRKLESLTLSITPSHSNSSVWREFALGLTFPSSLKNLSLNNTFLDWEEMTKKVGSLPHLETLCLFLVEGSEWSLVERKFLRLKSLAIRFCNLDYWNADSSHFPVLENLVIEWVSPLGEFPTDFGTIPTLRSIRLKWCSVSLAISAVRMVVEQEEEHGNEDLKLYVALHEFEIFKREMEEEGLTTNNLFLSQPKYDY